LVHINFDFSGRRGIVIGPAAHACCHVPTEFPV
jgi:hypothetical protein